MENSFMKTINKIQETGCVDSSYNNEQQSSSSNRKCPKCGKTMAVYLGANVTCPHCGYAENDLMNRYTAEPIVPFYTPPFITPDTLLIDDNLGYNFGNTGWICPKCGRGVSPLVSVCPCYHQDISITCNSNPTTENQFNQNNSLANDNINNVLKI